MDFSVVWEQKDTLFMHALIHSFVHQILQTHSFIHLSNIMEDTARRSGRPRRQP